MAKNNKDRNNHPETAPVDEENYSYGPASMGVLVDHIRGKKGMTRPDFARRMGMDPGNIDKFFRRKYLSVPAMIKASQVLGHDLFGEYRGNVKPPPGSAEEQLKNLKAYTNDLELQLREKGETIERLRNENHRMEGKIEALMELLEEKKR